MNLLVLVVAKVVDQDFTPQNLGLNAAKAVPRALLRRWKEPSLVCSASLEDMEVAAAHVPRVFFVMERILSCSAANRVRRGHTNLLRGWRCVYPAPPERLTI